MQIKIQCECGAKYSFDIEPVNGRMPVTVNCPTCGADGTNAANNIIEQQLAAAEPAPAAPEPAPVEAPKARLRVSAAHVSATPAAAAPAAAPATEGQINCTKHIRNPAASQCFICQKPICTECMSLFGYLCSVQCRYQAEQQKIKVPAYEFQKSRVEANMWKKVGLITTGIVLGILCLFVLYLWFYFVGSRPAEFYSVKWRPSEAPLQTRFLDKNHVLLVRKDQIQVHDLKGKKQLWSAPIGSPAPVKAGSDDDDDDYYYPGGNRPKVHVAADSIWVLAGKTLFGFDQKTGAEKQKIEIKGDVSEFAATDDSIMVVASVERNRKLLTRVDLRGGTVQAEEVSVTPARTELIAEEMHPGISPTAAFLLDAELDEAEGKRALKTVFSRFVFSGDSAVEMQVRLLQANLVTVEAMKAPSANSTINANTSVASDVGAVAEEIFNDIKRSRTGGFKRVDESRYAVTLRHHLSKESEPWSGEVVGPPALFPQKTVDVLVAGKTVYLFDKKGKKVTESKLTYPVAQWVASGYAGAAPCVEVEGMLYFYDEGVLTAFQLPAGEVLWRLTSVGISSVAPDGRGHLYVNTTTASPESIQYSEQINMRDPTKSILLKVDADSGKILWKSTRAGIYCQVSGKYVYAVNSQSGGVNFAVALGEAVNSSYESDEHFRIYRISPSSGSQVWEYYQRGAPDEVDFAENRILLQERNGLKVLKYLSF